MRIDKVTNGDPTLFIVPNIPKVQKVCEKTNIFIDFNQFLYFGFKNLLKFSRNKFKEINRTSLNKDITKEWYQKSLLLESEILGLKKDFTFILIEFLNLFSKIEKAGFPKDSTDYKDELISYCDKGVIYFRERIESNYIEIKNSEGDIEKKDIYEEKLGNYHPQLVHFEVQNYEKKGKTKKKGFIPYLLYDDIAEVFFYNKKLLTEENKNYDPIDLNIYKKYGILSSEPHRLKFRESFPSIEKLLKGDS